MTTPPAPLAAGGRIKIGSSWTYLPSQAPELMRTVPSPDAHGSVTRAGPFHPLMRTAVPRCERFRRRGPRPVDKPFFLGVGARIAWHRSQNRGTDALQRSFTRVALGAGRTPSTPTKREEKISESML